MISYFQITAPITTFNKDVITEGNRKTVMHWGEEKV